MKGYKLLIYTLGMLLMISCGSKKEAAKDVAPPAGNPASAPTDAAKIPPVPTTANEPIVAKPPQGREAIDENRKKIASTKKKKHGKSTKKSASKGASKRHKVSSDDANYEKTSPNYRYKNLTAGISKFGLLFTGISSDGVLEKLVGDEKNKSAQMQDLNAGLAASIWDLSYHVDPIGRISVTIELVVGDEFTAFTTSAVFDSQKMMFFSDMKANQQGFSINAECIDAVKNYTTCSNLLLTLQKGPAVAVAVLRHSEAEINVQYDGQGNSKEYQELTQFFKNANLDVETQNKVDHVYVNSFEVVKGKSGHETTILGRDNHVISLKSDLLVRKDYSPALIDVLKVHTFEDIDMGMVPRYKNMRYDDYIQSARLLDNSGSGVYTIELSVLSSSTGEKNKLKITVMNKTTATRL